VADSPASGVELAQQSRADHAIERVPTAIAAFVGRTLKGPVNQPVRVTSFAEFQQHFGGLWQPSTLSYAVEQFFENGGREAIIARVANSARPPTITLPAGQSALRLVALNPGSREYLRASVDYDGLSSAEHDRFNLVVQRVRTAGSELVEDQEIYRRMSVVPDSGRFVPDVLLGSRLVRVAEAVPVQRPDRSAGGPGGVAVGYTLSNPDGDDGAPLTDYDIIGAASAIWDCRLCWLRRAYAATGRRCCWLIRRQAGPRPPPRSMPCAPGPSAATAPSCTTRACRRSIGCAVGWRSSVRAAPPRA
jgi:hypothetical protein